MSGRNHLLDVRVIIVIRDISAARQSKFGPSVYSAREPHAQIILEATRSDFKRAGIYFARPIESEPCVRRDGVGLQRVLCARYL